MLPDVLVTGVTVAEGSEAGNGESEARTVESEPGTGDSETGTTGVVSTFEAFSSSIAVEDAGERTCGETWTAPRFGLPRPRLVGGVAC